MKNEIPIMTHPLSSAWDQPARQDILIDSNCAVMSKKDFDHLRNYSHSQPTGIYLGKMWKLKARGEKWFLAWYGEHKNPNLCSNNYREILIV